MDEYTDLHWLFLNRPFNEAVTKMITDRRFADQILPFLENSGNFSLDALRCGSILLTLATASFNKTGFTINTFKNNSAFLSPDSFITLIRRHGKTGLILLQNCPLGIKIRQTPSSGPVLENFGNWAFGNMTPVTEWGKIILGKEMGVELSEIGLQLLELSALTEKGLQKIFILAEKMNKPLKMYHEKNVGGRGKNV